jgi:hypothetical protein
MEIQAVRAVRTAARALLPSTRMSIRSAIAVVLVALAVPAVLPAGARGAGEDRAAPGSTRWLSGSVPGAPTALAAPDGIVLVGTDGGLYRLDPAGWTLLLAGGEILDLEAVGDGALAATRAGLFEWSAGAGEPWPLVVDGGEAVSSLAIDGERRAWAATRAGLFSRAPAMADFERDATLPPGEVPFVRASEAGVWAAMDGSLWLRRSGQPFERIRAGLDEGWWELCGAAHVGDLELLCVPTGLWWIRAGEMRRVELGIGALRDLEVRDETIWIATERGLYAYPVADLETGIPAPVLSVPVVAIARADDRLLAATESGVVSIPVPVEPVRAGLGPAIRPSLAHDARALGNVDASSRRTAEIARLHRAVLEHQGLTTDAFARVSERARLVGWLPKLRATGGMDRDRYRELVRDQAFTSGVFHELSDSERNHGRDLGFALQIEWDFAPLASPDDAIDLSRERRLVIQLRDQVLERVNRLYFERLRMLAALGALGSVRTPQHVELELQVEELAARLDGWSGGAFSRLLTDSPR